jgi:urease accessory protein
MDSSQFVRSLQISDSFFPVGAFAYSDGLETAATAGHVRDAASLGEWMDHFLEGVFVPCDGLALVKCMYALRAGDLNAFARIDEELTAIRPSASVRASSTGIGKRVLSSCESTEEDLGRPVVGNAAAAYAFAFFKSGVDERHGALAFGYNRLAGIVSAGLRLISIGQQQGQELLAGSLRRLPAAVDRILELKDEPLRSFSPLLDVYQMNHQYVYSRLFRS